MFSPAKSVSKHNPLTSYGNLDVGKRVAERVLIVMSPLPRNPNPRSTSLRDSIFVVSPDGEVRIAAKEGGFFLRGKNGTF